MPDAIEPAPIDDSAAVVNAAPAALPAQAGPKPSPKAPPVVRPPGRTERAPGVPSAGWAERCDSCKAALASLLADTPTPEARANAIRDLQAFLERQSPAHATRLPAAKHGSGARPGAIVS